jgi:hypothetical protein
LSEKTRKGKRKKLRVRQGIPVEEEEDFMMRE